MEKGQLETEWNIFDTLYTQWADIMDEQFIDQHQEVYDDIASTKDQALESATELISKDDNLTLGQELIMIGYSMMECFNMLSMVLKRALEGFLK